MSRTIPRRLAVSSLRTGNTESSAFLALPIRSQRGFASTSRSSAGPNPNYTSESLNPKAKLSNSNPLDALSKLIGTNKLSRTTAAARPKPIYNQRLTSDGSILDPDEPVVQPDNFRLSVYSTKHNTHINVSGPDFGRDKDGKLKIDKHTEKQPMKVYISLSAGNLGFRHSQRKHYDAAFQLASYVFARMEEKGYSAMVKQMDLQLRGFGAGREAVTKALLGSEGRLLRHKVVKVMDATRLKFGGTRSKKPRRL